MKRQILIGAAVLVGATALSGQNRVEYSGASFQFAGVAGGEGKVLGVEAMGSQVVTGKPFSAVEERHSIQVLGDGTHIESGETNHLYRDDQGRTRIERKGGNVTIFDPVAGFSAELDPVAKTISRTNVILREGRVVAKTLTVGQLAKLRDELAQLQTNSTDQNPRIVNIKKQIAELEKAGAAPTIEVRELTSKYQAEYTARMAPGGGERILNVTTADGPIVVRVGPGDNASLENLPAQMINGALAQGTRTTETIPVGKIGNDRVISIVNERWFSNDLQMLVKSTSSDPRFGDTIYQLTNIVQTAPDASLFQIPADYTIRK